MGQIQSSVNSVIGSAAILAGLGANSPAAKSLADKRKIAASEATISKKIAARRELMAGKPDSQESLQQGVELAQEHESVLKAKYDMSPNAQNLDNYMFAKGTTDRFQKRLSAFEAREKAMEHMAQAQEEKRMKIYGARGEVING